MVQSGPTPGPDETGNERSPEEDQVRVARGLGAPAESHLEEDRYIGVRVNYTSKPAGQLPPEQASLAGDDMAAGEMNAIEQAADAAPPIQDVRITPDEPSVWEALDEEE
jgi:hypothetical protein